MTDLKKLTDAILDFWLREVGPKGWYESSAELDAEIVSRFGQDWEKATDLAPAMAQQGPEGALAALILTDQFPRNMFRNSPRAFSTDSLALQLANEAIARGDDMAIGLPERQFFYLPFEHSEELADQDRAVELIGERIGPDHLDHARWHRAAIAEFGRFPWRNAALGRASTEAEIKILEMGGYGAIVKGLWPALPDKQK